MLYVSINRNDSIQTMKADKEPDETAVWPKIAFAFVAGLALAGAGAWIVVKNLAPKTPPAAAQVTAPAAEPSSTRSIAAPETPAADLTAQPDKPLGQPVATPEMGTKPPPTHKSHPSAFGDPTPKQPLAMVHDTPWVQHQDQATRNTPPNDTQAPQQQPQDVQQNHPQYAPLPDVAPVPPQSLPPTNTTGQTDMRQDGAPPSPARQPQTVTIEAGTSLMVRLDETLSTKTNVAGDSFRGTLDQPIILNGFIIADRGSKVVGRVAATQKGGHLSGSSDLSLELTEINTTDGQTVRVQTSPWEKKGDSNTAGNIEKIGGGAAIGAIIGALAGGGKGAAIGAAGGGAAGTGVAAATGGKPTVVPVETRIAFRLNAPVTITEKINN